MTEDWNMRSLLTGAALGIVLGGAAVGFSALAWPQEKPADPRMVTYQQLELFAEILARARQDYVVDVDESAAMEAAINGMLTSLDPHSGYLNPDDFRSMQVQTSGEYGGLGIEVTMEDGFVKVISPMDNTPASRAGIQSGDLITAINGKPIIGQTLNDAVKEMRGDKGTDILITILRVGEDPFDVTLTREVIEQKSVTWKMQKNDIGYLRISSFNERTTLLLEEGIEGISKATGGRPKGLIVDLRNNGGGLLDQAVSVSGVHMFLSGGEVVSTQGRRASDIERYNARTGEVFQGRAHYRPDQWRICVRLRNRCRCPEGPGPRDDCRHDKLRQGVGPDRHSAGRRSRCHSPDDRALLHTVRPLDPGAGHRSGYRDCAGAPDRGRTGQDQALVGS